MRYLFLCVVLLVGVWGYAQPYKYKSMPAKKAVYAEFLGASVMVGMNYDSRFYENSRWGYRIGVAHTITNFEEFGVCDGYNYSIYGFNFPLEVNYLVGRRETKNKLDLGVGLNLGCYEKNDKYLLGYFTFLNIGYRFQPKNGIIFRVGLSPKLAFGGSSSVLRYVWPTSIFPYLSFGYAF